MYDVSIPTFYSRSIKYDRGSLIGEEPELIQAVSCYLNETFPKEISERNGLIYPEDLPSAFADPIVEIHWGKDQFANVKTVSRKKPLIKIKKESKPIVVAPKEVETESEIKVQTLTLLRSMGAEAFLYYYLPLKSDIIVDAVELASKCPKKTDWTFNSKRSRASVAKRIFNEGREQEALELILNMNVSPELLKMAKRYYDELINSKEE